jgi:hypothetical protein
MSTESIPASAATAERELARKLWSKIWDIWCTKGGTDEGQSEIEDLIAAHCAAATAKERQARELAEGELADAVGAIDKAFVAIGRFEDWAATPKDELIANYITSQKGLISALLLRNERLVARLEQAKASAKARFETIETMCKEGEWYRIATEAHIGRELIDHESMVAEQALNALAPTPPAVSGERGNNS